MKQDILKLIVDHKQQELVEIKHQKPIEHLKNQIESAPEPRKFIKAIQDKINHNKPAVIAEIKKASPSKGVIREDFHLTKIAQSYEQAGATCLSILTENKFFQGNNKFIGQAKQACDLPILRKDFIVDPYQVYESRSIGADCILLITSILNDSLLSELYRLATDLQLDVLVEVHTEEELIRALALNCNMIGINNRDLHTFVIRLNTTLKLAPKIPKDKLVVTESGIRSHNDIQLLRKNNIHAFLIGEALMAAEDPGEKLQQLLQP